MIQYDGDGVITEWGPANTRTLVDHDVQGRVLEVDAWMVLYVTVCTHNNDCDTLAEEEHWQKRSSFVVERWDQIFAHFEWFYGSAGIANRLKWEVERWLWNHAYSLVDFRRFWNQLIGMEDEGFYWGADWVDDEVGPTLLIDDVMAVWHFRGLKRYVCQFRQWMPKLCHYRSIFKKCEHSVLLFYFLDLFSIRTLGRLHCCSKETYVWSQHSLAWEGLNWLHLFMGGHRAHHS